MKHIEKTIFWILYLFIAVFAFFGSLQHPLMPIIFVGSLVVWYFILKGIFWVIRRCYRILSIHISRIPKTLWQFILNRVREFGKAFRNE